MVCHFLQVSMVSQYKSTVLNHSFPIVTVLFSPLIAFKTFILYYSNLILMHLGRDFFGFTFEFSEPLEFVCLFSKLRGFSAIISLKNFQQHTIFFSLGLTQRLFLFFFHFIYLLFFILNKFVHLPVGWCFPMYYLFCHWSNWWPPFRGKVLFLGLLELI